MYNSAIPLVIAIVVSFIDLSPIAGNSSVFNQISIFLQ